MPKVNVSLSQDILLELDRAARDSQTSRSAFLAQAIRHYLKELEEQRQVQKREEAAAAIDRFREKFGGWDATSEVLKWRDRH